MTRNSLSRSTYVDAALEVIGEVGVDKLSMRNVASRLQVSPMAMYNHFATKDDLLSAALEEFIARANVIPDDSLHWEKWVGVVARGMYDSLCREMGWVPLLGTLRLGTQAAAVTDAFVKKLCSAGFTAEQALRAYFAIIQIVVGAVCLRSSLDSRPSREPSQEGDLSPVTREYLEKPDRERLRNALVLETLVQQDQIEIGLPLLIDALRAQLRDAGKSRR